MALIECPRCKRKLSKQAEECPACGYLLPPVADMLRIKPPKIQSAERTKKVWKILRFFGIAIMIVGAIAFISANEPMYSPFLVLFGVAIFLLARIGACLKHD